MGCSTNGKIAHRVIPFVLKRVLLPHKAINLSLRNEISQWIKLQGFGLKSTYSRINFSNLFCEALNHLHERFAIGLQDRSPPSCCLCLNPIYVA